MIHNIHLYGHLREEFGPVHRFDIATAGEAIRALNCAFPRRFIEQMKKGSYRMVRGDPNEGMHIDTEYLNRLRLGEADLHVIPVASGSKSTSLKGGIEAAIGVAIIGAAIFFSGGLAAGSAGVLSNMGTAAFSLGGLGITYGNIAGIGLAVTMLGVATLISKPPINNDNTSSYTFSGPVNVDQQGAAVPLIFGTVLAGSQAISAGYQVENIGAYTPIATV